MSIVYGGWKRTERSINGNAVFVRGSEFAIEEGHMYLREPSSDELTKLATSDTP